MSQSSGVKFSIAFALCFLFRLLPFRPPNVEPILAAQMPFAKKFGARSAFFFGFFSIILFDIATGRAGLWTLITALAYGALGIAGALYFSRFSGTKHYVFFAILGTLFYDAATGLTIGPMFFNQTFVTALIGQIPFTLMHLSGNVAFAALCSPLLEKWIGMDKKVYSVFISKSLLSAKS